MIRISIQLTDTPPRTMEWAQDVLKIGRAQSNHITIRADSVSGSHAEIILRGGRYIFADRNSTNGSIILRNGQTIVLRPPNNECPIEVGDRLCLANPQNSLLVDAIVLDPHDDLPISTFEQTIIAEQSQKDSEVNLEESLGDDHEALRLLVRLSRELVALESMHPIGELLCRTSLHAFPRAARVAYLIPSAGQFVPECVFSADGSVSGSTDSSIMVSPELLNRCLREGKGFLFMIEQNQLQAVATMITPIDDLDSMKADQDRVLMCCPMFHNEQCHGFLIVEAPLALDRRESLTRGDLSLGSMFAHLVGARLADLQGQKEKLSVARKATAGFMSSMVGHCFKNLLFVPMSISRMLPICIQNNQMDQVEWMLARNQVTIRYLDILSNEFAAASKDPSEGFGKVELKALLVEVQKLLTGISPDKLEIHIDPSPNISHVICHGAAITRMLMNLALNAVDAILGVEDRSEVGRITIQTTMDDDCVVLHVMDNGPGIPEQILENLNIIYDQVINSSDALGELQNIAERVRSTKDQGLKEHYGLGFLFVCQTIHHHHGSLVIEAIEGKGSTFRIWLPTQGPAGDTGKHRLIKNIN